MTNQSNAFFTPTQLANLLQVKRQTVYAWIKTGKLTVRRAGKGIRIDAHELETFLRSAPLD